jgi:hypothetical protein
LFAGYRWSVKFFRRARKSWGADSDVAMVSITVDAPGEQRHRDDL